MNKLFSFVGKVIVWGAILFFGTSIGAVVLFKYVPVPCSPLMFIRVAQQLKGDREVKMVHEWVPLDSMSADLPRAVWASEDQNFFNHSGFDLNAISQAIKEHEEGKNQRGASTISQQTAKNVFLWPQSTWTRKMFETYFTILIEHFWDKHRIMEVYLNTIEMGDGIYGAKAVAHEHFNCEPAELTRNQCALIAASLPNPLKMNSATPTSYMYRRQTWILKQMRNLGPLPAKSEE